MAPMSTPTKPTLSVFLHVDDYRKASQIDVTNFCTTIDQELHEDPARDVPLTEIRHYKEKGNMEHEFLVASVQVEPGRTHFLRLERSTLNHKQSTLGDQIRKFGLSVLPALDTVHIAKSVDMLTNDMKRGEFYPVASLRPSETAPLTLGELCLILNLFPTFSPDYKLRGEHCYWFCNIVLTAVRAGCGNIPLFEEEGWSKMGKFQGVSAVLSEKSRELFVETYETIRHSALDKLTISYVEKKSISPLIKLLGIPIHAVGRRATAALLHIAKISPEHQIVVLVELFELLQTADASQAFPIIEGLTSINEPLAPMTGLPSEGTRVARLLGSLLPSLRGTADGDASLLKFIAAVAKPPYSENHVKVKAAAIVEISERCEFDSDPDSPHTVKLLKPIIKSLIPLLSSESLAEQRYAITSIALLSSSFPCTDMLLAAGCVPPLIPLLSSSQPDVKAQAGLVAAMFIAEHAEEDYTSLGGLVSGVTGHLLSSVPPDVQLHVAKLVDELSAGYLAQISKSGVLPGLARCIAKTSPSVRGPTLRTLYKSAFDSARRSDERNAEAGGLEKSNILLSLSPVARLGAAKTEAVDALITRGASLYKGVGLGRFKSTRLAS